MTKEDLQHIGKHHLPSEIHDYPTKITEASDKLLHQSHNTPGHGVTGDWKLVERTEANEKQKKSDKVDEPWHALAATRKDNAARK